MTTEAYARSLETQRTQSGIIDRLMDWIEHVPIPYLSVCLIIFVVGVVPFQLIGMAIAQTAFWPINLDAFLNSYLMAYGLGLMLFVRRSARQSLAAFAPVLNLDDAEFQRLLANLIRTPTTPAVLTGGVAIATSLLGNFVLVGEAMQAFVSTPTRLLPLLMVISLTYGTVGILMYDLIRKLWLISRIYTLGGKLDLFNRRTLYAFSGLTARILAGWLILSYPSALLAAGNWRSPAWLTITGLALAAILSAFVYTLLHMHQRMRAEKERVLLDVQNRLQQAFARLHAGMDQDGLQDVVQLKALVDSLVVERDVLKTISTWPWQSETLAGFATVVLAPAALWLIETLVKKLLGTS